MSETRTFVLRRTDDVSGVSGLGDVASGVVFPDGTTVLRWNRAGGSTAIYDSLERMEAIHGHDGRTSVVWDTKQGAGPMTPQAPDTGLREAALALFEPMDHGSPSKPKQGHTVEAHCAACVSVRSKRTQAIRRALVALGDLPSVSFRAATPQAPDTGLREIDAIEGTVRYVRSDRPKECICCPGEPTHVFGYHIEGDDGKQIDGTGGGWMVGVLRRIPDGTRVRLAILAATPDTGLRGLPWHYAHAAGIEGLPWDIYATGTQEINREGWLVASVAEEADAALIVEAVNRLAATPDTGRDDIARAYESGRQVGLLEGRQNLLREQVNADTGRDAEIERIAAAYLSAIYPGEGPRPPYSATIAYAAALYDAGLRASGGTEG